MNLILKIKGQIDTFLGLLCGYMLLASTFVIIFSIISRYIGLTTAWVEESVRMAVVWTSFLGAYVATAHGEDIKVGLFDDYMSLKSKMITGIVIEIIISIFLVIFFPLSIEYVIKFSQYKLSMTGIPLWLFYLCFPVGSFMMLLHSVLTLINHINTLAGMVKDQDEAKEEAL